LLKATFTGKPQPVKGLHLEFAGEVAVLSGIPTREAGLAIEDDISITIAAGW